MPHVKAKDGISLHYSVHDYTDPWKKSPVLFLQHGLSRSSEFWYGLIPYLARYYKVVCPDLRGVGRSSADFDLEAGITLDNYLSDLVTIADDVGAETFHYAGESLGGIIGFFMGAHHADRLRTLSVLSSPLGITPWMKDAFSFGRDNWETGLRELGVRGWSDAMNSNTRFPADADPAMLAWYSDQVDKSMSIDVLVAMSYNARRADPVAVLDRIAVPTLGIYPTHSRIVTQDQLDLLRTRIPDSRIVQLPMPYHMTWVIAPAACANCILHFIATHDGIVCHEG